MSQIYQQEHNIPRREEMLMELYEKTFPAVARFVSKRGGTFEQAKDIFHDALIIWYEKQESKYIVQLDANRYVFGIAKHLWYRQFNTNNQTVTLEADFEDLSDEQPSSGKLLNLLETTGKRCLEMLKYFYFDKMNMTEVAAYFGFKSERSATVQKYKCLEKVREVVKHKSLCYEDFLD